MFNRALIVFAFTAVAACSAGQTKKPETQPVTVSSSGTKQESIKATVSLFAGSEKQKGETDDTDPLKARFSGPKRLAWDSRIQTLYVGDGGSNSTLRKIDAAGKVTTVIPWRFLGNYDEIFALCLNPEKPGGIYFTTKGNRLFKFDPDKPLDLMQTGDQATNPQVIIARYKSPGSYNSKKGNETGSL